MRQEAKNIIEGNFTLTKKKKKHKSSAIGLNNLSYSLTQNLVEEIDKKSKLK